MNAQKKVLYVLVPFFLLIAVISFRVSFSEKIESLSLQVFDHYQKLKPRDYQNTPVRFVDIDDESLAKLGQWPWPRTQMAELISKLSDKGAAVIAMDILFAEPDRTSPANILPLWNSNLAELKILRAKTSELPDHDKIFADTISKTHVITGYSLTEAKSGKTPVIKAGFAHSGDDPLIYLAGFKGFIPNLPSIEKAAAGNGSFNFLADSDGILRRVPLIFRYENKLVPSLAAEALRVAQGASSYVVKSSGASGETSFGERTGIISVKIGNFVVPTDSEGRMWLYDSGKVPARYLPAWKVFEGKFDPKSVEGSIIFLGTSAAGLKDLRVTPLNPVAAGTEIHVQLVEQILTKEFLNRPDWAFGAEMSFLILLALLLIFFLPRLGAILCLALSATAIICAFGFSWNAFIEDHYLFDPVTPSVAILIIYLAVSLMNFLRTESEKKQVRGAFGRYVSPHLLEQISQHPEQLKLGGETRNMTILFADIRNFTTISEQYTAEELTKFMNAYLTPMTDIILKAGGTIDKYIGDCIMAFWNAPLPDPHHAQRACQAALAMQEYLKTWNAQKKLSLAIGIGLNTGECSVGNMGSNQRFDYSVLGDDVNLASRLEGQSKLYGVDIVTGPKTAAEAKDVTMLELDLIRVKGKNKPVHVFALFGDSKLKENSDFKKLEPLHQKMLTAYRKQQWQEAEILAGSLLKEGQFLKLEKLYRLYQERIENYKRQSPGPTWDGVSSRTSPLE